MELWTFVNKETGDIIRFNKIETGDSEFGTNFYFIDHYLYPAWFCDKLESINFLLDLKSRNKSVHPQYSQNYETPDFGKIDLNNYDIKKIVI